MSIVVNDVKNPLFMGHEKATELIRKIKKGGMSEDEIKFLEEGEINKLLLHVKECQACKEEAKSLGLLAKPKL